LSTAIKRHSPQGKKKKKKATATENPAFRGGVSKEGLGDDGKKGKQAESTRKNATTPQKRRSRGHCVHKHLLHSNEQQHRKIET